MAIDNREDLHACPTAGVPNSVVADLDRGTHRIYRTFALVERAFLAQRIRQLGQNLTQDLAFAPLLTATMSHFVLGIALRQQMSLRTGVRINRTVSKMARVGYGFAAMATLGRCFSGKYA